MSNENRTSVLLLDKIGTQAEPILTQAGLRSVNADRAFGKDVTALAGFISDHFISGELKAVCLRSGTTLGDEALAVLRQAGVELVVRFGAGVDNIDLLAACRSGILVENTPGQNSTSVAEKTMLCAGMLCHRMNRAIAAHAKGQPAKKNDYVGTELFGKTIGVIGFCGWIGAKVATRARDWYMTVLGYDEVRNREIEGVRRVGLAELLAASDFVTAHVPLNDGTRNLIGRAEITQMRTGAFLLNFARAGIVDIEAVSEDLISAAPRLGGYGSDVDEAHPVFNLPNTVLLPHIGASTTESEARCAVMGASQVESWLNRGNYENGVNFRDLGLRGQSRNGQLTIIHDDKPGRIEKLAGFFADQGINIGPFQTAPNGKGFACTIIGPDEPFNGSVVASLAAIDGVIRVLPLVH